jgi:hypothetical protein
MARAVVRMSASRTKEEEEEEEEQNDAKRLKRLPQCRLLENKGWQLAVVTSDPKDRRKENHVTEATVDHHVSR